MLLKEQLEQLIFDSRSSLDRVELRKTLEYISLIDPKVIVQIGVNKGYTMELWKKAFNPSLLIGITANSQSVDQSISESMTVLEADPHKEETADTLEKMLDGKIVDFLVINSDHSYEGVKREYELYEPFVRKGGIVAFPYVALSSNEWRLKGYDVQRFWVELISKPGEKYYYFWNEIVAAPGIGIFYIK